VGNNSHPLAVVVALGGSLKVVKAMVDACPEALDERLGGGRGRTLLHYAISEGAHVEIIQYLTSRCSPSLVSQTDSFGGIPLHLAASYPSSSICVLLHLLEIHPDGAHALDKKSQTALHRACKSRATLTKIQALIEANPMALFWKDFEKNTPLGWAERMDHSLSDVSVETIDLMSMMEDVLTLGCSERVIIDALHDDGTNKQKKQRAIYILYRFSAMSWYEGIRIAFACNRNLTSLIDIPFELYPELLSLLGKKSDDDGDDGCRYQANHFLLESLYAVLLRYAPGCIFES